MNGDFLEFAAGMWFLRKQSTEVYNYSFQHTKKTRGFTYKVSLVNKVTLGVLRRAVYPCQRARRWTIKSEESPT